jgi:hypothetical protein
VSIQRVVVLQGISSRDASNPARDVCTAMVRRVFVGTMTREAVSLVHFAERYGAPPPPAATHASAAMPPPAGAPPTRAAPRPARGSTPPAPLGPALLPPPRRQGAARPTCSRTQTPPRGPPASTAGLPEEPPWPRRGRASRTARAVVARRR